MTRPGIYTVGGTVQASGGVYISRPADEELLKLCQAGEFAHILTTRHVGKSSLMIRTAARLRQAGITPVIIDFNLFGLPLSEEEEEAWYLGLLVNIGKDVGLQTDIITWWDNNEGVDTAQRLVRFFETVLLAEIGGRIVIFIDEIEMTLTLDFTDALFAAIRMTYEARKRTPTFERLSFVLIGSALPEELVNDPKISPFTISQAVDLPDFTFEEAKPLVEGLSLRPLAQGSSSRRDEAEDLLRWALQWTKGHPYLTQRLTEVLSRRVAEIAPQKLSQDDVAAVVDTLFFGQAGNQDNNLQFVPCRSLNYGQVN